MAPADGVWHPFTRGGVGRGLGGFLDQAGGSGKGREGLPIRKGERLSLFCGPLRGPQSAERHIKRRIRVSELPPQ